MVRDITRAAYTKWVAAIGREPTPMTANYEQAVIDHVIDLLEEHGRPMALIEIIPGPLYLLIENIAVRPDRHGEGIDRSVRWKRGYCLRTWSIGTALGGHCGGC